MAAIPLSRPQQDHCGARVVAARRNDRWTNPEWSSCLEGLPSADRERVLAFRSRDDADASLLARSLMIELAADALDCAMHDIRIGRGVRDRPFVAAPAPNGIDVNATHAGGWVAAAMSRCGRIGVDLEPVRPVSRGLIERCLSTSERSSLGGMSSDDAWSRFFHLWTVKEAYLKATGLGLSVDPRTVEVVIAKDRDPELRLAAELDRGAEWYVRSWNPEPGVWLSVCSEQALPVQLEWREGAAR